MGEEPLVKRALEARVEAHEQQTARARRDLDARIRVGIRLVLERLGVQTTADQWGAYGNNEAQIVLDGVILHTGRDHSAYSRDILKTGEREVRSLANLGDMVVSNLVQLNEVTCPTCHGAGKVVDGAVTKAEA